MRHPNSFLRLLPLPRRWIAQLVALVCFWAAAPALAEPASVWHVPPAGAVRGKPVVLNFQISHVEALRTAIVHWRHLKADAWQHTPVVQSATREWQVALPASEARDPGIAYYITAIDLSGAETEVFASADAPHTLYIRGSTFEWLEAEHRAALRGRYSELAVRGEAVEYRLFGPTASGDNPGPRYYDVTLRYRYYPLRVIEHFEFGVGRLDGTGEANSGLHPDGVRTGFQRGWTQVGLRAHDLIGLAGRLELGADETGFRLGGAAVLRIGRPFETHLTIDGGGVPGVGWHLLTGLHLATLPSTPVDLEAILTNAPDNASSSGERIRLRVGRRLSELLQLSVLLSYQGRQSADHGLGAGAEVLWRF